MGSDLFALSALACELNETLKGARIDKIQQPEVDELRFFVRSGGKNLCLCISCNSEAPRIHLTTSKKPNPSNAPQLCMLLRKYLSSANIVDIEIVNCDRILKIKFSARTEMRDDAVFYLFVEIMNRYSNIIFTDENLIILDAVKRLGIEVARDHIVLRGVSYKPLIQAKISYLNGFNDTLDTFSGGNLSKHILANVSGLSPASVLELLQKSNANCDCNALVQNANCECNALVQNANCECNSLVQNANCECNALVQNANCECNNLVQNANINCECGTLSQAQKESIYAWLTTFQDIKNSPLYSPCIIADKEVYPFPYQSIKGEIELFSSMSQAYDTLYSVCDNEIRNKARLKVLNATAKRLAQKVVKNIIVDHEKLDDCKNMDKYRLFGEMVVTNIYKIKKGDTVLKCINFYDNCEIEIPLDERLTPSKNSAAYFNKYNKLKRTKEFVEKKLVADNTLLSYINSIQEELASLPFYASTSAIEDELATLSGIRKKPTKNKIRKEKTEAPYTYKCEGFTIMKGRNNLQNDELTFKIASSGDIWLHMKNLHGAHTVIVTCGKDIPDSVLKVAGEIAASANSASCEVDFTERRNVKRQPDGHPGQVIYVKNKTMVSVPNEHKELLVN